MEFVNGKTIKFRYNDFILGALAYIIILSVDHNIVEYLNYGYKTP